MSSRVARKHVARAKIVGSAGLVSAFALLACGCRHAEVVSQPATPVTPQVLSPLPRGDYIPEDTMLNVQLGQQLGTEQSKVGDRFTGSVITDVPASDGSIVVPRGTVISGVVTELKKSGRAGDTAAIGLGFQSIAIRGRPRPLTADVINADVDTSHHGSDVAKGAGGGALAGGVLGAILGGGSGALTGGVIGAAGGSLIGLGAGGVEAELPAGTVMTIRITQPIDLSR
jgi:hypothetical protein